jgi:predicted nucleotidyltransferase
LKKIQFDTLKKLIEKDPQLKFLNELIVLVLRFIEVKKIILFGSRARGDHTRTSDVDIAFVLEEAQNKNWPRFVAEADENLKTLLKLDLVRMDRANEQIKQSIEKEGHVIYE